MTEPTLTPSKLWKHMTSEQRNRVARAFWQDEEAIDDQMQAVLLISQQKKFRPKYVLALDEAHKTRHLATLPTLPDHVAARALVLYHLAEQRPMMGAFLDALGMPHEDGLIQDDVAKPDSAKMGAAAALLAETFPADDVRLYLNTLLCQDAATWGALADVPQISA